MIAFDDGANQNQTFIALKGDKASLFRTEIKLVQFEQIEKRGGNDITEPNNE